jgi:hypothetical protein
MVQNYRNENTLEYHRVLRGYCSYKLNDLNELQNIAWDITDNDNKDFIMEYKCFGCIPLIFYVLINSLN